MGSQVRKNMGRMGRLRKHREEKSNAERPFRDWDLVGVRDKRRTDTRSLTVLSFVVDYPDQR